MEIYEAALVANLAFLAGVWGGQKKYLTSGLFQGIALAFGWYFATH